MSWQVKLFPLHGRFHPVCLTHFLSFKSLLKCYVPERPSQEPPLFSVSHPVHDFNITVLVCVSDAEAPALTTWCEELIHWKRPWCWEGLRAGRGGDNRGWGGWMASPTQWIWVWVYSGSWWWTGRPGNCGSWGHKDSDTTEQLNWTELNWWDQVLWS